MAEATERQRGTVKVVINDGAPTVDLGQSYNSQMERVKVDRITSLMQEAFQEEDLGEFGFTSQPDTPVNKAGIIPEPEGIPIASALKQVFLGGPMDAAKNSAENITGMGQDLRNAEIGGKTVQQYLEEADKFFGTENFFGDINAGGLFSGRVDVPIGTVEKEGGPGVQLLRGLMGFATAMMAFRGAGANTFGAGVGADLIALDNDENLSNMINDFLPEDSPFRNPIIDFLEAKTDDTEFAKSMKSAAEGIGIAIPIEVVSGLARLLKAGKQSDVLGKEAKGSEIIGEQSSAKPGTQPFQDAKLEKFRQQIFSRIPDHVYKNPLDMADDELEAAIQVMRDLESEVDDFVLGKATRAGGKGRPKSQDDLFEEEDLLLGFAGSPVPVADNFQAILRAKQEVRLDANSAKELGEALKFDLTKIPEGYSIDVTNNFFPTDADLAVIKLNEAFKLANEQGFDLKEVSMAALKGAADRFSDPEDALFMLRGFLKKTAPTTQQSKRAILGDAGLKSSVMLKFDNQDFDVSAMQLPFEKVNNEKILKGIREELDATIAERVKKDGELPLNKKGREVAIQAEDEIKAREKFFADPEGETKRLLEFDPNKKLNRIDEIEFALVRQASLQRIDDLVKAGDESSAMQAFEQAKFHFNVIEEQHARFSEAAGRDLAIRNRLKKGELGEGQKLASVGSQVKDQMDINIDPLAFAQKWRETNPKELAKEVRRLGGSDMLFEAWVNSLFGLKTHVVNTLGNVANLALQTVERGVASQIRKTKRAFGGSSAGVQEGEATAMLYGMLTSQPENFAVLAKNLGRIASFKEIPASQFQKLDQANVRAINGKNFGLAEGSFMYQGADIAGHIATTQGKLLLTMDEYFKMTGYSAAVRAEAFRVARSEGKTGKALAKRIAQLVENPSPSIKANAKNFADYATFTKELGVSGKKMHEFINTTPFGRYVVPFHNVLVNIAKFSGERTPLAVFSKKIRADLAAGGARADLAQARMATGTAASMAFLSLALGGGLTGGGPQNKQMKAAWKRKNNQPYSFVVIGKDGKKRFVSYQRAEPVAFFAGMMADFVEIADQISEGERIAFAKGFALTMSQHFLSQTFAKSVSDFMMAFQEGRSKFFENLGSSFIPYGGVFRDLEKVDDPVLRDTKTVDPKFMRNEFINQFGNEFGNSLADSAEVLYRILNNAKANLPGYSKELPPRVNMWGDVVAYETAVGFDPLSPFFIQTEKDTPVDDWILKLKVPIGLPEPAISSGDPDHPVNLNPEQYHDYLVLAGKPAFAELDKEVRSEDFKSLPDGAKAKTIELIVRMHRTQAAQQLLELTNPDGTPKYPDLNALLNPDVIAARQEIIQNKLSKVTRNPGK